MPIRETDLRFYGKVIGQKPHLIFVQDNYYVVFAEMERGTRGHFIAFHKDEVDKVERELQSVVRNTIFHCDDIYMQIRGMNIDRQTEKEYLVHRLRNICYILVKNKVLELRKDGNTIYFRRIAPLTSVPAMQPPKISQSSTSENGKTASTPKTNPPSYKTTIYSAPTVQPPKSPQSPTSQNGKMPSASQTNTPAYQSTDNDFKKIFLEAYKKSPKRPDGWVSLSNIGTVLAKQFSSFRLPKKLTALVKDYGIDMKLDEYNLPIVHVKNA